MEDAVEVVQRRAGEQLVVLLQEPARLVAGPAFGQEGARQIRIEPGEGPPAELEASAEIKHQYLGL